MNKFEMMDTILEQNKGILISSDVIDSGVTKQYLSEFIKKRGLQRIERGLYIIGCMG